MPFNGSGSFSRSYSWVSDAASSIPITATRMDADSNDFAAAFNNCLTRDGQGSVNANFTFNNYKGINLANPVARTDAANLGTVQDGTYQYLTLVSGTNTIVATAVPALPSLVAGQVFWFVAAGTNTGPCTLKIGSLAAVAITKSGSVALSGGEITAGAWTSVGYDGTEFQLIGVSASIPSGTTATTQPSTDNSTNVATTAFVKTATLPLTFGSIISQPVRTYGTLYTNSSGAPMVVMISAYFYVSGPSGSATAYFQIGGNSIPIWTGAVGTSTTIFSTFIVPSGATYELTTVGGGSASITPSINYWTEQT